MFLETFPSSVHKGMIHSLNSRNMITQLPDGSKCQRGAESAGVEWKVAHSTAGGPEFM